MEKLIKQVHRIYTRLYLDLFTSMIIHYDYHYYAKASDNNIYYWGTTFLNRPDITKVKGGPWESLISTTNTVLMWDLNGHLFSYNKDRGSTISGGYFSCDNDQGVPVDITSIICKVLDATIDQLCHDIYPIYSGFMVRTEKSIGVFHIENTWEAQWIESLERAAIVHTFDHEIDMVSPKDQYGIIRTTAGELFAIGAAPIMSLGRTHCFSNRPVRIPFPESQYITQILCATDHIFLLLETGQVYAQGSDSYDSFQRISFPEGITITKIIGKSNPIIYLTSDGTIYYSDIFKAGSSHLEPIIFPTLSDKVVEDVFIIDGAIAVVHSGGQLLIFYIMNSFADSRQWYVSYIDRSSLLSDPISFANEDTKVASVYHQGTYGYIVTDRGQVYHTQCYYAFVPRLGQDHHVIKAHTQSVPFFDSNPIAVPQILKLASGRSMVDEQ